MRRIEDIGTFNAVREAGLAKLLPVSWPSLSSSLSVNSRGWPSRPGTDHFQVPATSAAKARILVRQTAAKAAAINRNDFMVDIVLETD